MLLLLPLLQEQLPATAVLKPSPVAAAAVAASAEAAALPLPASAAETSCASASNVSAVCLSRQHVTTALLCSATVGMTAVQFSRVSSRQVKEATTMQPSPVHTSNSCPTSWLVAVNYNKQLKSMIFKLIILKLQAT
jgi:hypothetical protein